MKFPPLLLLLMTVASALAGAAPKTPSPWQTDLPKAQAQARAESKLVLVHFSGSDWCGWCIKLHKDVFSKPEFEAYAKTNLVLVELDFPKTRPQPAAVQKANQAWAEHFHVRDYPTLVVLNAQGTTLGTVNYGQGGAKVFISQIEKLTQPKPVEPASSAKSKTDPPSRQVADKKVSAKSDASESGLTLKGISGPKHRRVAVINNHSFSTGETANVKSPAGKLKVRCVEIRDTSVVVTVDGRPELRELRLAGGT